MMRVILVRSCDDCPNVIYHCSSPKGDPNGPHCYHQSFEDDDECRGHGGHFIGKKLDERTLSEIPEWCPLDKMDGADG